jgi:thiamine monophosphate kinase
LRALEAGEDSPLTAAHLRPPLRLTEGRALAREAHALMDISDGLAADLPRLAAASGVRCVVDLDSLPCAQGVSPEEAASGGEDYELLAAVANAGAWVTVGRCEEGAGATFLRSGQSVTLEAFDHFR